MVDVASAESALSAARVRDALRDVFAGTICSVLTVAYWLSYAALIFSGPLAPWLSYGIAVTFISAAVGGAIVGLAQLAAVRRRRAGQSTSAVTAALVAAMAQR